MNLNEKVANRCVYVDMGLQCVRAAHPDHPNAHIRVSGSCVPDRHGWDVSDYHWAWS